MWTNAKISRSKLNRTVVMGSIKHSLAKILVMANHSLTTRNDILVIIRGKTQFQITICVNFRVQPSFIALLNIFAADYTYSPILNARYIVRTLLIMVFRGNFMNIDNPERMDC
ncbi:unnamed protein product [Gordionus sp. m RMFG-2023]